MSTGAGTDALAANGGVTVGGSLTWAPGHDINQMTGAAARTVRGGDSVVVTGGKSHEAVNFAADTTALIVGGNIGCAKKSVTGTAFDFTTIAALTVGRNVADAGGPSNDQLLFNGLTAVGGGGSMTPGRGRCNAFHQNGPNALRPEGWRCTAGSGRVVGEDELDADQFTPRAEAREGAGESMERDFCVLTRSCLEDESALRTGTAWNVREM